MKIVRTRHFKKDYKLAQRQKKDLSILRGVVKKLISREVLEPKYKDHRLSGQMKDFHECHLQSDWLLIYQVKEKEDKLVLVRMGSHSELFR